MKLFLLSFAATMIRSTVSWHASYRVCRVGTTSCTTTGRGQQQQAWKHATLQKRQQRQSFRPSPNHHGGTSAAAAAAVRRSSSAAAATMVVHSSESSSSTVLTATSRSNVDDSSSSSSSEMNDNQELESLLEQITHLNQGQAININSPKQVSSAIFGEVRSTTRDVLQQAADGVLSDDDDHGGLDEQKQQLASLVLRCRELAKASTNNNNNASTKKNSRDSFDVKANNKWTQEELPFEQNENIAVRSQSDRVVVASNNVVTNNNIASSSSSSSYEQHIDFLFNNKRSKINTYWRQPLHQLSRPSARALVWQLDPQQCPMGFDPLALPFDPLRGGGGSSNNGNSEGVSAGLVTTTTTTTAGKKGTFLAYCREQKEKYPDCIILTRCGDFYETFGVDAIMLVEHCGLNSMAGKAKAGCPIRNVQATLDCLTSQGFRVAVYEEGTDTDALTGTGATGGAKSRIKNRFLAQIVSAASPTYLYDLVLLGNADTLVTAPPSRPYVGVLSLSTGYTLVEVSTEERSVRVSERLTAEAVACRLAAYPPADPLLYVPSPVEYKSMDSGSLSLPFLPSRRESSSTVGASRFRTRIIPPALVPEPRSGLSDVDRAKNVIVSTLLQAVERREDDTPRQQQKRATVDDFTLVLPQVNASSTNNEVWTQPLYVETATQLGLMNDPAIPNLVSYLVLDSAPAATKRFLRRYLITPPPPMVAEAMRELVSFLKGSNKALPPLSIPPVGKSLALLRAGQASAQVYAELLRAMHSTILFLDAFESDESLVHSLMILLEYESGLAADPVSLRQRCLDAIDTIESVVSQIHHTQPSELDFANLETITDFEGLIPRAFFERNEATWRGRVREDAAADAYDRVRSSAAQLANAVAADFWGLSLEEFLQKSQDDDSNVRTPIVQDIFNNIIALKDIPSFCDSSNKDKYFHPRDRNGKVLKNRYTTEAVQSALSEYVTSCEHACQEVTSALISLSETLYDGGHIPSVVQGSHANLILSSAFHHATRANSLGWNMAETYQPTPNNDCAGEFVDVWPYWIDKSEAVANTFELSGMWLLTAPNMSGKSTLMRSTAAAALLTACGLCAPLGPGSRIRRYDHIFVRGASADVPAEQKSAFGAEMGDIAALLRCCGDRSLVFVDELGRGTSPHDGTRLAGAVLEAMASSGMSGVFATHLHDILKLPLQSGNRVVNKRMAIHKKLSTGEESSQYYWTYRLEDGVCTDSMALVTAERFGLPTNVIERAEELSHFLTDSSSSNQSEPSASEPSASSDVNVINGAPKLTRLVDIARFIEKTIGQHSFPIPPQWNVPASLDGKSCVYVLEVDVDPPLYYVGESDNLRQRITQHRAKKGIWTNLSAIVFPAEGKSQARAWESQLIQKLAKSGVNLLSTSDGRSIRQDRR